jgi:hypothetical protein
MVSIKILKLIKLDGTPEHSPCTGLWYAHPKSPQPMAPFHPLVCYTLNSNNYDWYWNNVDFTPALGEYSNQTYTTNINRTFTMFLTVDYTSNGYITVVADPSEISGSTISFGGILTNNKGLPIQATIAVQPNEEPECDAEKYSAFRTHFNDLMSELDTAEYNEAVSIKFAIDVAFYSDPWTNCVAQLNNLLNTTVQEVSVLTTECVADPSSQAYAEDSCCSQRAYWSSVCRPREVQELGDSYNVISKNLGICGSATCTQSFLEDFINSPPHECEDLTSAILAYTLDKRIYHFTAIVVKIEMEQFQT